MYDPYNICLLLTLAASPSVLQMHFKDPGRSDRCIQAMALFCLEGHGKSTFYHDRSQINENTVINIAYLRSGSKFAHFSISGLFFSLDVEILQVAL